MSVVVNDGGDEKSFVFVKGSPEKLARISKPGTVPKDFEKVLNTYTM